LVISRAGHDEILHIVATKDISAADMKHLQQQLSQIYPTGYPFMNFEGERLVFHDIVQHTFTDGGVGGGHMIPRYLEYFMDAIDVKYGSGGAKFVGNTAISMIHAGRDDTIAKFNEVFGKQIEAAKMTPYKRHIGKVVDEEDIISALPMFRYSLIRVFIPSLSRACEFAYRCKALHEATLTVLAIKRYREEKGQYPISLSELVAAGYIEQVPMDPYSDKRVIYKKTDDSFVLYSLGPDFDDDGGVENPEDSQKRRQEGPGDEVFWPIPKSQAQKEKGYSRKT
jgi:competence protein ComGC